MCKLEKSKSDFAKATGNNDGLQRGCRECKHNQYLSQKGKYIESGRKRRIKNVDRMRELKNFPCQDCKIKYHPSVMEFDHVRGEKIGNISLLITQSSWKTVLDEISKCDLVCANCHRMRTYQRLVDDGRACDKMWV